MLNYYLHRDGKNHGPYSSEQLKQLIASDQIRADELVCEEGGADWVAASTLSAGSSPPPVIRRKPSSVLSSASNVLEVTQEQVRAANQKLKNPFLGIVFSVFLPFILWAAKSDTERGVGTSGRHGALKELAKDNVNLLPLAIVVGVIGAIACSFWLWKSWKRVQQLKSQLARQR